VFFCTIDLRLNSQKAAFFAMLFLLFFLYTFSGERSSPPPQFYDVDTNIVLFCLGYGFVDFENPVAAETAVKALQAKGVQAQMAKVGISLVHRRQSVRLHDKLVGEYNHTK
jgi:hypothetical protein